MEIEFMFSDKKKRLIQKPIARKDYSKVIRNQISLSDILGQSVELGQSY